MCRRIRHDGAWCCTTTPCCGGLGGVRPGPQCLASHLIHTSFHALQAHDGRRRPPPPLRVRGTQKRDDPRAMTCIPSQGIIALSPIDRSWCSSRPPTPFLTNTAPLQQDLRGRPGVGRRGLRHRRHRLLVEVPEQEAGEFVDGVGCVCMCVWMVWFLSTPRHWFLFDFPHLVPHLSLLPLPKMHRASPSKSGASVGPCVAV